MKTRGQLDGLVLDALVVEHQHARPAGVRAEDHVELGFHPAKRQPTALRDLTSTRLRSSRCSTTEGGTVETTQNQKAADFRALHEGDPFIIPNPWDAGSAKVLARLGFKALASTSSGFAFTLGRRDGGITMDEVIAHTATLDGATELPV